MNKWRHYLAYLAMIIMAGFVIIGNSLSDTEGFLSPDSTTYLRLAERILNGDFFTVPNSGRAVAQDIYWAIWPVGYPALIAAMAKLLPVGTFLASKALNLFLLAALIFMIYKKFGTDGLAISTLLLSAGTLNNFSMTWSEAPFIFFISLLSIHLGSLLSEDSRTCRKNLIYLFILIAGTFLSRYIGIFAFSATSIIALIMFFRGRKSDASKTILIATSALLCAILYLLINKIFTGYTTGMPRNPATESNFELARSVIITIVREFTLPLTAWDPRSPNQNLLVAVFCGAFLIVVTRILNSPYAKADSRIKDYSLSFLIVGVTYLGAITFSRWTTLFDGFSFRLIDPGFVLIFLGTSLYALSRFSLKKREIYYFLFFSMTLSIFSHAYAILERADQPGYFSATQTRRDFYSTIPDDAIILFGTRHLNYLRPSVHIAYPRSRSYSADDETMEEFLSSLDHSRQIFIDTGSRELISGITFGRYHESVRSFLDALPRDSIIPLGSSGIPSF